MVTKLSCYSPSQYKTLIIIIIIIIIFSNSSQLSPFIDNTLFDTETQKTQVST